MPAGGGEGDQGSHTGANRGDAGEIPLHPALAQAAGVLGKLPRDVLMLDDFYVAARYPDAVVEVPYEMFATPDAEAALRVAAESLDIVRKELSGDG